MKKVLLTGGTGQLGSDCREVLGNRFRVVSFSSKGLNIADANAVHQKMSQVRPQVVLNCAAFTKVDDCETERETAWKINVEGPENLARASRDFGARLVHISTDYVFDGLKKVPEPYMETDETGPLSYYGLTKLEGEEVIRRTMQEHAIVRTAWLYGAQGRNFLKTMLRLALTDPKREIKVVNDQFGSPTWSYRLALQIGRLIESKADGTYHATAEEYGTWFELAGVFLEKMGVPHTLVPCATAEYPTPAKRPANSILESQRLKEAGIHVMRNWKSDVQEFVLRFKDRLIDEAGKEVVQDGLRQK